MKYAVMVPDDEGPASVLASMARLAEDRGWDGFFVERSLWYGRSDNVDPFITIGLAASQTSRIRLGVLDIGMPADDPWQLERSVLTLARMAPGRVIMGVGGATDQTLRRLGYGDPSDAEAPITSQQRDAAFGTNLGEMAQSMVEAVDPDPDDEASPYPDVPVSIWATAWDDQKAVLLPAVDTPGVILISAERGWTHYKAPTIAAVADARAKLAIHHARPDIAVVVISTGQNQASPAEFEAAGATWWLQDVSAAYDVVNQNYGHTDFDGMRRQIHAGPPT